MGRSRGSERSFVALAIALSVASIARADVARWDETRARVIDPIDRTLRRDLPGFVTGRNLDAVLGLYATDVETGLSWDGPRDAAPQAEEETLRWAGPRRAEPLRARYRQIFDLFADVGSAEVRIERVEWDGADADGYPAEARLIVRGAVGNGSLAALDERLRLRLAERGGSWKITRQEVVARALVVKRHPRFEPAPRAAGIEDAVANVGAAIADVDDDGCEDVFLPGSAEARLYANGCNGTFTDVTAKVGLPRPFPAVPSGAVFFDYDDDRRPDLFVTAASGGNRLFHNVAADNGPRFVDVTAEAGIGEEPASMATVADYDGDGFLDVYVVRAGGRGALLRNQGDGKFRDVTRSADLDSRARGGAAAWGDYDGDGYPDLAIAGEDGATELHRNRRDGTFEEVGDKTGARIRIAASGIGWGDYDGDGDLDLFVSARHAGSRWALAHPDHPRTAPPRSFPLLGWFTSGAAERSQEIADEALHGSTLLRNDGNGAFTDVSDRAGVHDAAAELFDYDDDGLLDLFLHRNDGDGRFTDVAFVNGIARSADDRQAAIFDYDRDGQLDVLLRGGKRPTELMQNLGGRRHWLELKLVGTQSNKDAVGAKIRLRTRRGWQTRVVSESSNPSGQSTFQHFGLGAERSALEVAISWPSGATTHLDELDGDHLYLVTEASLSPLVCADVTCPE